ncbi:5'-AMP-activated protein kinase, catalytic alpha subunit [Marchantia polymorpha subsp. ruderalis]|uniref:non-specific serine/threonine protein kinase n=2 Tax=Marchantia polymorpha TaxID=3197 RepID=A0A176W1F4_MARPO|nr:hypothetical protein AXG93_131s1010 [Marchantia polymorpha subsp. ruderalis]PTQ40758.1 hypothetical protein MARPO_0038s0082 [Marchantia polymorpha]PTQ40759.1 hypothetical protein MARPO_0038s0082 [Marchantia polymorpha]BBN15325.1 hypothetical protein Mp_6g18720 [Marchantia polymorpha subsp. ruderalis]BBN15326.1 hypothetical protein Mp_6g18720 [Marchantia polymorpha subsp. ruderalis]|eukprot:PTQ40758.1 hypothetical protein MARPO_0038s0082 [Marchantia polymorpha]
MENVNGGGINIGSYGTSTGNEYSLTDYKVGKTIGLGSFGKVKMAEHSLTGQKVAIKILHRRKIKEQNMDERVKREINILRLIMHPHIIRLYEVIETPTHIFLVLEYLKSGELFDYIIEKGRLPEGEARRLFQQILSGVEYCHSNMVVHRDLKPENLLLDSTWNVKIADFGLSNIMRDGHFLNTSCGSPNYAAPEVISGKLYAGPEVDVWSCGVILYALLCGTLPYDDENIPTLFRKIKGGIYTLPSYLSTGAKDLISRMLLVDPVKRITIPEVRQHSWFQTNLRCCLNGSQGVMAQHINCIDEDIVKEVVSLGFQKHQVKDALRRRVTSKATVTYYLLLDNRRCSSNGRPRDQNDDDKETSVNTGSVVRAGLPLRCIHAEGLSTGGQSWVLGFKTPTTPRDIMTFMLKSFQELDVHWKKMGPYTVKGRWNTSLFRCSTATMRSVDNGYKPPLIMNGAGSHCNGNASIDERQELIVNFETQLYLTKDDNYLLDLQYLHGPDMVFLEFCYEFQRKIWSAGI